MDDHTRAHAAELVPILDLVHPRVITDADRERFEGYLDEIFSALGLDNSRPRCSRYPAPSLSGAL
jgi:hypothetical protein